jgi:hypothetical protein
MEPIIFEPIYSGSTFPGYEIELFEEIVVVGPPDTIEEVPVDLTGASIIMNVRSKTLRVVEKVYSTDDGSILVDVGKITIPQHDVNIKAGIYVFDMNILLSNGEHLTGFASGQWTILEPITERS